MKAVVALVLLLSACAVPPERFFSDEEDAAYRKLCEPAGCVTLTIPEMAILLQKLKRAQGLGI